MQSYLGASIPAHWQYTLHHLHLKFSVYSVYNLYKSLVSRLTKPLSHRVQKVNAVDCEGGLMCSHYSMQHSLRYESNRIELAVEGTRRSYVVHCS